MAINLELRRSVGSAFTRVNVATHWELVDGKPQNFPPSSHDHTTMNVQDVRGLLDGSEQITLNPNNPYFDKKMTGLFGYIPAISHEQWKSVLTIKGWDADYSAFQLIGNGTNDGTYDDYLYFRSGRGGTWNPLRRIYHEGFKPNATDVKGAISLQSDRDFAYGTMIETNIDYSVQDGHPFLLEIEGNSYGSKIPFMVRFQGYIYGGTVINFGGFSVGTKITGMVLFNWEGKLCFFFPRQAYWHGYTATVRSSYGGYQPDRVVYIHDTSKPWGVTKEVEISSSIKQVLYDTDVSYDNYAPGKIVARDGNGYTFVNYINSNTGNSENPSISQVIVTNGSDSYYRKASLEHLKSALGSMPASSVPAAAQTTFGGLKARLSGTTLYLRNDGSSA